MQVLYTAQATATGGRNGKVESSDGVVKLDLTMPKSLGGAETPGTSNPEQLFASGYAACFAGAVGLVARNAKVEAKTVEVTARLQSEQRPTPWYRRWYVWFGLSAGVVAVAALVIIALKLTRGEPSGGLLITTNVAIRNIDFEKREYMRLMSATWWQTFVKLEIPDAPDSLRGEIGIAFDLSHEKDRKSTRLNSSH